MADLDVNVIKLFRAIKNNDHEEQKNLLQHRVWVHTPDPGGRIALIWAVIFGDRLTTRRVIKLTNKKGLNMVDNIHGCSALHYAVMEGRTDVVKSLLDKGAHVNIANQLGMTPLHYAAQTLNELIIKMLITRKANKWYVDNLKRLPYHVAVQWGSNPNILHLLEPKQFHIRRPGLPGACACGKQEEIQLQELVVSERAAKSNAEFIKDLEEHLRHKQVERFGGSSIGLSPRQSPQPSPRRNPLVRPSSKSTPLGISWFPSMSLALAPISKRISPRLASRSPPRTPSRRSPTISPRRSPRVRVVTLKKSSPPRSNSTSLRRLSSHKSRKSGGLHAHFEEPFEDSSISCCPAPSSCVIGCALPLEAMLPGGMPRSMRRKSSLGCPPLTDN